MDLPNPVEQTRWRCHVIALPDVLDQAEAQLDLAAPFTHPVFHYPGGDAAIGFVGQVLHVGGFPGSHRSAHLVADFCRQPRFFQGSKQLPGGDRARPVPGRTILPESLGLAMALGYRCPLHRRKERAAAAARGRGFRSRCGFQCGCFFRNQSVHQPVGDGRRLVQPDLVPAVAAGVMNRLANALGKAFPGPPGRERRLSPARAGAYQCPARP